MEVPIIAAVIGEGVRAAHWHRRGGPGSNTGKRYYSVITRRVVRPYCGRTVQPPPKLPSAEDYGPAPAGVGIGGRDHTRTAWRRHTDRDMAAETPDHLLKHLTSFKLCQLRPPEAALRQFRAFGHFVRTARGVEKIGISGPSKPDVHS